MSTIAAANAFYEWTIAADDTEGRVARALRICVGNEVRKLYGMFRTSLSPQKLPTYCIVLISKKTPGDLLQMRTGNASEVPNESRSQRISCQGV